MKILLVSQYFYPEEFKVNDLAAGLVECGHSVTVLTGKPNYPQGTYFEGYGFWGVRNECYKGAKVIRIPLIRRGRGTAFRLVANYLSFAFFGSLYVWFHKMEYDYALCFQPSPITQIYPALVLKRKCKCKVGLWVQDLWPESVSAAGNVNNQFVHRYLNRMVRRIYAKCDTLFVQSEAFSHSICTKGPFEDKVVYAPNWAEDLFCTRENVDEQKYQHLMPEGFLVMFAGNVGAAQDFDSILKAASLTKDIPEIKWVIVGDGRKRDEAERQVKKMGLEKAIVFLGRYPVTEMPAFFVHADAMLISLRDEYIFSLTIPSKLQAYMAFGKPVLSMINGIGNDIIKKAGCGLTANAGDAEVLADNVRRFYEMDRWKLKKMGENGFAYYEKNFARKIVVDRFCQVINDKL